MTGGVVGAGVGSSDGDGHGVGRTGVAVRALGSAGDVGVSGGTSTDERGGTPVVGAAGAGAGAAGAAVPGSAPTAGGTTPGWSSRRSGCGRTRLAGHSGVADGGGCVLGAVVELGGGLVRGLGGVCLVTGTAAAPIPVRDGGSGNPNTSTSAASPPTASSGTSTTAEKHPRPLRGNNRWLNASQPPTRSGGVH